LTGALLDPPIYRGSGSPVPRGMDFLLGGAGILFLRVRYRHDFQLTAANLALTK